MTRAIFPAVILAIGFAIGAVRAAPMPAVDVPALVDASDLIVGRAEDYDSRPVATGAKRTSMIAVDRILKGAADPRRRLEIRLGRSDPRHSSVTDRQYGVFFLRRTGIEVYEAADPFYPVLPASPNADIASSNGSDPLTRVARELTAVFATAPAVLVDPSTGVQGLMVGEPVEQAQSVYHYTASALETILYEIAGESLRAVAASDQLSARLWAVRSLIAIDDEGSEASFIADSLQSLLPVLLDPPPELAATVHAFTSSLKANLNSPTAFPSVVALLRSKDVTIRRAAASMLSKVGQHRGHRTSGQGRARR